MPIYVYRCSACDHTEEVLQKFNDPAPACSACQQHTLVKQVTAAGFQLKGSGWYVTDFRDPPRAAKTNAGSETAKKEDSKTAKSAETKTETVKQASSSEKS